mmetsp:Transcript_6328/g.19916  ORF Transcript_6328/g.19916 Transcript_6328/m.19916 type:complete len:103 (-) Transcript_6328:28-336(-)
MGEIAREPVEAHGGRVVTGDDALGEATHLIFSSADKKSDRMIDAAVENDRREKAGLAPVPLVSSNWLLDGMYLEQLPPPIGPYAASAKLLQTLLKKAAKRGQ